MLSGIRVDGRGRLWVFLYNRFSPTELPTESSVDVYSSDKETPPWAPDQPPVYTWAADEAGEADAWYVSYNGWVRDQPNSWGNPRHGYRCARDRRDVGFRPGFERRLED